MKWLTFIPVFFWSCTTPPPYKVQPTFPPGPGEKALMQSLSTGYPAEMKLTHRLIITAHNKQYDLTGYLLYRQPDHYYAAAYVEAGAPVFEMVHSSGTAKILRKPKYLPEVVLFNGIMDDLIHIYSNKNPIKGQVVTNSNESVRLVFPRGSGYIQEYLLNQQGTLFASKTAYKDKLVRSVRYDKHKKMDGFELPEVIYLENYRTNYQINIQLLSVDQALPKKFDSMIRLAQ